MSNREFDMRVLSNTIKLRIEIRDRLINAPRLISDS